MRGYGAAVAILLALACTAAAQEPQTAKDERTQKAAAPGKSRLPTRWWKDQGLTARLALTPAQVERIDGIFEAFLPAQRERWNTFRPLERELDELLREPRPNEAKVIDLITRVETLRGELNRNRLVMLFRIQQVLTPPQRAKLQELGWPERGSRR